MQPATPVQDPPREERATLHSSPKTILVVDDEPLLLHLMREILAEIGGYKVRTASISRDALLLAAQEGNSPHLLVLDYMLTGSPVNGLELYDLLHERWPGVPAIIVSCNAPQEEVCQRHILHLAKPFDLEQLLATVADALAAGIPVGNR